MVACCLVLSVSSNYNKSRYKNHSQSFYCLFYGAFQCFSLQRNGIEPLHFVLSCLYWESRKDQNYTGALTSHFMAVVLDTRGSSSWITIRKWELNKETQSSLVSFPTVNMFHSQSDLFHCKYQFHAELTLRIIFIGRLITI